MGGIGVSPEKDGYKTLVELMPVQGHLVDYRSDEWDFKDGFKYQRRSNLKIRFDRADEEFRVHLKDYAVMLLDSYEWKVSTVSSVIAMMSSILNHAVNGSAYGMFILLDTEDIISSVEAVISHSGSRRSAYSHIMRFIEFIRSSHSIFLPVDLDVISKRMTILSDIYRSRRQHNHHKRIPDAFYDSILQTADRVMRDDSQPFNMRMTAGIVLMNTQLGLRCLEILALEKDCIHEYNCGDGLRRYFTTYNCIKGARADVEVIQVKSICTPLLLETWSYMTELRKQSPYSEQSRFLYTLDIVQKSNKASELPPVNRDSFIRQYKIFFGTYLKSEIEQDWKGIERVKLPIRTDRNLYSIPTIHNFRVHFATSLYAQDFPLDLIESIMSHTPQSNSFDSYYAVDDEEFKRSRRSRQTKGLSGTDTEDEFDTFIETLGE